MAKTTRFLQLATFIFCAAFLLTSFPAEARTKSHSRKHSSSHAKPLVPAQSARYAMVTMDAQSGKIVDQKDMHKSLPPASLTKIMTLFMTFEALQRGQIHMDDSLKITQNAMRQAPSKIGLNPNNPITVREAIYVVVTRSANDVAMALAETIGGSEQRFTQMMTARARSLGMNESNFANPSGLPNPRQKSSAYDMAVLARATMQYFPQYYHIFNTIRYNYRGQTVETHNNLMRRFKGMDGLKTGYTVASGFNLVASSVRNNRRVIVVVFGGTSAVSRDNHVAGLMDEGLDMLQLGQQKTQFASAAPTTTVATKTDIQTTKTVTTPSPQAKSQTATVATKTDEVTTTVVKTVDVKPVVTAVAPASPVPATATTAQDSTPPIVFTAATPSAAATPDANATPTVSAPVVAAATADRSSWQPDGGHVRPLGVPASITPAQTIQPSSSGTTSAKSSGKNWGIQVGAYNSKTLGQQGVKTALAKVRHVLSGEGQPVVVPSQTAKGGMIYRARIIGLSAQNANKACRLLAQCMTFATR